MQPSDTAYPRFKTRLTHAELEQFYTPTEEELAFCASVTLLPSTRLGFVVLLKTFQRLGYFVLSSEVPEAVIKHIATATKRRSDQVKTAPLRPVGSSTQTFGGRAAIP